MRQIVDLIHNWEPRSETFFLRWNAITMCVLGTGSALYITESFRKSVRLARWRIIPCYGAVLASAVFCNGYMRDSLVSDALVRKCYQSALAVNTQVTMTHMFSCVVVPSVLNSFISLHLAAHFLSVKVAAFTCDPWAWLRYWYTCVLRPHSGRIACLAGVNAAAASLLLHVEAGQMARLLHTQHRRLMREQQQREDNMAEFDSLHQLSGADDASGLASVQK